jgi:hypothetical protein
VRVAAVEAVTCPAVGTKAERRAARALVAAYHEASLAELIEHVAADLDRYRAGHVDAYTIDETIHHYHRAAQELWKFCWSGGAAYTLGWSLGCSNGSPTTRRPSTGGRALRAASPAASTALRGSRLPRVGDYPWWRVETWPYRYGAHD